MMCMDREFTREQAVFSDTDVIRYGRLDSWEELCLGSEVGLLSFKEALFPISDVRFFILQKNEMKTADGAPETEIDFFEKL